MKSCFFIGHREASSEILPALRDAVEQHIVEYGVTEFIVGHYGGFDRMAAKAVIDAKAQHPEITLSMLIPYHPAERPVELPPGFDNTFYPPGMEKVPRRLAIVRANRYVVDHVDYLIAHVRRPASNARDLVEYAEQKKTVRVTLLSRKNLLRGSLTNKSVELLELQAQLMDDKKEERKTSKRQFLGIGTGNSTDYRVNKRRGYH